MQSSRKVNSEHTGNIPQATNRKTVDLANLLKIYRKLSNILVPAELYQIFADAILEEFQVDELALFIYSREVDEFELVYRHGLDVPGIRIPGEEHYLREKLLLNKPIDVAGESGEPAFQDLFAKYALHGLQSVFWVPLVMRDKVVGFLTLGKRKDAIAYGDSDFEFISEIAAHAAVCINTCRLYGRRKKEKEDLDKTLQNLSLLYSIGKAMNYISDLKNLLQYILGQAIEITAAEKGSIMLYDMEKDRLAIRVLAGMEDTDYQEKVNNNEIECRSFKPGEGIAGRVFITAKPLVVNNIREDDGFIASESSFVRSIVCIPMIVYNDVIGVINVTNKRDGKDFTDEDVEMLKAVADQAAVAVNKAQLWDMAVTDSLTGLHVRRYFMVKLQEEIHRAERYNKVVSIVMADLDRFKFINDTYGHDAGDKVLKNIGKFFQRNIREVDTIARYGGEEFVIMLPDADKDAAFGLAERIRTALAKLKIDDFPNTTISLGVATYPHDGTDMQDLIRKADAAMYSAKQAGRNKAIKYSSNIKFVRATNDQDTAGRK